MMSVLQGDVFALSLVMDLSDGLVCVDTCDQRGRKRAEVRLSHLLTDMKAIVDSQSQTDPQSIWKRILPYCAAVGGRRYRFSALLRDLCRDTHAFKRVS
jgi:hypothetical protein